MRRVVISLFGVGLLVLGLPGSAVAEVKTATVVNIVDTSGWFPPSPDAMGITYDPSIDRLVVVDSEVEEIPSLYDGVNGWLAQTDGTVTDTFVTVDPATISPTNPTGSFYTPEPTDITHDPTTGNFFVASDGPDRTFEIDPGLDGKMGGGDDVVVGEIRHLLGPFLPFPAHDVEGISYGDGALWMGEGNTAPPGTPDDQLSEIYRVLPGPDGLWSGGGQWDNVVTHWDTARIGQPDPEGVAYDPATGHLLIVSNAPHADIAETTTDGVLVGIIEGSGLGIKAPSSLALAPASGIGGGSGTHLYVADRGVDNDINPGENDGKIYELALAGGGSSAPAVITDPGPQVSNEGQQVSLQVVATDAEEDALVYTSQGLPPGLSLDISTGLISGIVATGAFSGSPYTVDVFVGDGTSASTLSFTWTVRERPPTPTGLTAVPTTDGIRLDWDDSSILLPGYNVYRSLTEVGGYTKLNAGLLATSDHRDTSAPTGTTLFYRVTTVDTFGSESLESDAVSVHRGTIALRGASTANNGSKGATSLKIPRPSGTLDGDVLVAVLDVRGAATITAPDGWTFVRDNENESTLRQAVYHHTAAAGETQYVFTFDSKQSATGAIAAYSGVASVGTRSSGQANAGMNIVAPSVSTPFNETVLIGGFGIAVNGGIAPPIGMDERAEAVAPGRVKVSTEISDQVVVAFGGTGPRTARATKAAPNIGQLVMLLPMP